jgi:hypothetical protein
MKYKSLLLLIFLSRSIFSLGQTPVAVGNEFQELVRIGYVYENAPNLSFNLRFTYADSLTWQTLTDSMHASCKLSYGRSFMSNNDMEILKGSEYYVFVDKEDSLIMAAPRRMDESIFQMPLLDSVFLKAHVSSVSIHELNDTAWKFRVIFNPDSYYSLYEMVYNPKTMLIYFVNYHARNDPGAYDIPSDHIVCAFVYMTNYSDATIDPTTFNESRYFYKLNGSLYLQQAWNQFEFENL